MLGKMESSSNTENAANHQHEAPKLQIYPTPNSGVSPYWRGTKFFSVHVNRLIQVILNSWFLFSTDKYERDAKKYWDVFYKRHQDRVSRTF